MNVFFFSSISSRQSNNPADCCSVLIKTEGCEDEPEVDVEGVEGETHHHHLTDDREGSIEPPRRRDSSDPVNLCLNSGASTTSEGSHDVVHRWVKNKQTIKIHFEFTNFWTWKRGSKNFLFSGWFYLFPFFESRSALIHIPNYFTSSSSSVNLKPRFQNRANVNETLFAFLFASDNDSAL